jgi:hypothetical protein
MALIELACVAVGVNRVELGSKSVFTLLAVVAHGLSAFFLVFEPGWEGSRPFCLAHGAHWLVVVRVRNGWVKHELEDAVVLILIACQVTAGSASVSAKRIHHALFSLDASISRSVDALELLEEWEPVSHIFVSIVEQQG